MQWLVRAEEREKERVEEGFGMEGGIKCEEIGW